METYIIRIYRFEKDNPRSLVGIVETIEKKERGKRSFHQFGRPLGNTKFVDARGLHPRGKIKPGRSEAAEAKFIWQLRSYC